MISEGRSPAHTGQGGTDRVLQLTASHWPAQGYMQTAGVQWVQSRAGNERSQKFYQEGPYKGLLLVTSGFYRDACLQRS